MQRRNGVRPRVYTQEAYLQWISWLVYDERRMRRSSWEKLFRLLSRLLFSCIAKFFRVGEVRFLFNRLVRRGLVRLFFGLGLLENFGFVLPEEVLHFLIRRLNILRVADAEQSARRQKAERRSSCKKKNADKLIIHVYSSLSGSPAPSVITVICSPAEYRFNTERYSVSVLRPS